MNPHSENHNGSASTLPASAGNFAFKEWASVVEALATGEQFLILRKGGIHEKGKKFNVLHESFFLFPTYEHQNAEDLNSRGQQLLRQIAIRHTTENTADLRIEYFVKVTESLQINKFKTLQKLSGFHVWSENALRKRFDYGGERGIYALIVRVHRLPAPMILPNLPAYGGCRSWVELSAPIPLAGMQPVLSDTAFLNRQSALRRLTAI